MRKLFTIVSLIFSISIQAQSYNIRGVLQDTAKAPLSFSSVFLLHPKDSTLVTFTRADDKGTFLFKNVKKQDYILKSTFVGLFPIQFLVKYDAANLQKDVGIISMKPIQKELFEIVVRTAKAPIEIRGDTIEYDASKFKVPPGSSVEDLLRKLPGMQVDAQGNLKAQGETVQKVLVDGKQFFGGDPKQATKNLSAEAIKKVQVFNDKTEQAKLTGVDDGKHDKTVNLELKDEFKKGGFGKVTAGVGTDNRLNGKINYNKFDDKNQFAIVGFGNNLNQTGLNRDDYQDFKGSQSYNWNDNADFGFSQGGWRFYSFSDDEENVGMGIPQSWGQGKGLSENYAGGINYNYDTKKTKFSSNYFYNQTNQSLIESLKSQTFLPNTNYFSNTESNKSNFSENHRMAFRFEKSLDSLNTLVFSFNGRAGNRNQELINNADFLNNTQENFRKTDVNNSFNANSYALSSALIFRHKFKKKGRNFAMSGTLNQNQNEQDGIQKTLIKESLVTGQSFPLGSIFNINQNVLGLSKNIETKSSILYTEPLSKKFNLETFYNFGKIDQEVDRDVFDLFIDSKPRKDSLSRYFENKIINNRVGSSIRFTHKTFNVSVGAAAQQIDINGDFFNNQGKASLGSVKNSYKKLLPNVNLNYEVKSGTYLYGGLQSGMTAPPIKDLQPFTDNTNPLYVTIGNPNLKPTTNYSGNMGFGTFNPVSFIQFWSNVNYNYNVNQVVYNQTVDSKLITTVNPENITGGQSVGSYFNFGFPIKKTKATASINFNTNFSKNLTYINNVLNNNNNQMLNYGLGLDLTPVNWFSMFSEFNVSNTNSKFSVSSAQNQKFTNTSASSNMVLQMPKFWFINMDFNYNAYKNTKLNFDQKVPLLNISAYKVFGKTKKSELRLTLNDAFKKNLGINQSAFQNVISNSSAQTLTRYLMLSYTYNMKGIKTTIKKSTWE